MAKQPEPLFFVPAPRTWARWDRFWHTSLTHEQVAWRQRQVLPFLGVLIFGPAVVAAFATAGWQLLDLWIGLFR